MPGVSWRVAVALACAALAVAAPPAAALSVSIPTPPVQMTITHATPGTSSMIVSVVSVLTYTMTIHDGSATTPGFMDRVTCATTSLVGGSLGRPLHWASPTTGASGDLSATPATVATGVLLDTVQVDFTQTLDAAESVAQGDCYYLPVTITVT